MRTVDDDNFIDDTGVEPALYGSDNEAHSPSRYAQVGDIFSSQFLYLPEFSFTV